MAWWNKIAAHIDGGLNGRKYRVLSTLYNFDGSRAAALFDFGLIRGTYILEQERAEDGKYVDRHDGALVGPFTSPKAAEHFIVATHWFNEIDATSIS